VKAQEKKKKKKMKAKEGHQHFLRAMKEEQRENK